MDIVVTIPFKDRELWIERIDKHIERSDERTAIYHQKRIESYESQNWFVRFVIGKPETMEQAKREFMSGIWNMKRLKETLQATGWETLSIDSWRFKMLQDEDNERA